MNTFLKSYQKIFKSIKTAASIKTKKKVEKRKIESGTKKKKSKKASGSFGEKVKIVMSEERERVLNVGKKRLEGTTA